jgi:streptogramin lyase
MSTACERRTNGKRSGKPAGNLQSEVHGDVLRLEVLLDALLVGEPRNLRCPKELAQKHLSWKDERVKNGLSVVGAGRRRRAGVALLASSMAALLACPVASADPVGQVTEVNLSNAFCCDLHPNGIAAGPDGNLWYPDDGVPWIARLTPGVAGWITETTNIGLQWTEPGDVSKPTSIALGPTGNLWFTDNGGTKAIGEVDGNGFGKPNQGITGEFSQGLQQSGGTPLGGIAPGPDGNMWFADDGTTPEIGQITPEGEIQEFELPAHSERPGRYRRGAGRVPLVHRRRHQSGDRTNQHGRVSAPRDFVAVR